MKDFVANKTDRVPKLKISAIIPADKSNVSNKYPYVPLENTNSFSLQFAYTSPRLEHRYRKRFEAADGTQNLAIEPTRMAELSHRWSALEAAWNRPFLSARAAIIPSSRASITTAEMRCSLPVTGDFQNDSVFSPQRRTRTGGGSSVAPWEGFKTTRETEQQRVGEWASTAAAASRRVRTAGARCYATNYAWESAAI